MTVKSQRVVRDIFEALFGDSRLLPPDAHALAVAAERENGTAGRARIVADYVAGMTDRYALDEYERLSNPRRLR
jgi:dGTPase